MRCQDTALAPGSCHHRQETSLYGHGPRAHVPKTTAEPAMQATQRFEGAQLPRPPTDDSRALLCAGDSSLGTHSFPDISQQVREAHDSFNPNFKSRMRLVRSKTCKNDVIENSAPVPGFRCQSPKQSQTKQKMRKK